MLGLHTDTTVRLTLGFLDTWLQYQKTFIFLIIRLSHLIQDGRSAVRVHSVWSHYNIISLQI